MELTVLLGEIEEAELKAIEAAIPEKLSIVIPLRYIGSSQSHLDVCADIRDASWACERFGAAAVEISAVIGTKTVTVEISRPTHRFSAALRACALVYDDSELLDADHEERDNLQWEVADYESELDTLAPRVPELVDWYLINLVNGANYELRSESPEAFREQMLAHPERQVDYFKSAYRHQLGHDCFASSEGWICAVACDLDHFFEVTGQKHRLADLSPARFIVIGGRALAISDGRLVDFPVRELLRSQICTGYVRHLPEDDDGPFDWLVPPWALAPVVNASLSQGASVLVDESGTLIVIRDADFWRLLYVDKPLGLPIVKSVQEEAAALSDALSAMTGGRPHIALDWASLDDEQFEQLCYDLIAAHPRYDEDTIRKLGKSRSRDGGRDIQVHEHPARPWEQPRKWVFQCKLYTSGSLGTSKVRDVGDMIDEYDIQGFGVMASVPIDATLYARLDGVCERRDVKQQHWSVYELERALARNATIRRRYFGS